MNQIELIIELKLKKSQFRGNEIKWQRVKKGNIIILLKNIMAKNIQE